MCSSGKSGSFFYFTFDSKYLMKTIPEHEFSFFESMLKDYYEHMFNNKDTLLQRYFGLHAMNYNNMKLYFVIMNNVFTAKVKVDFKYDLKGSKYQRISRDPSKKDYIDFDFSIPMKDLDFLDRNEKICLSPNESERLYNQISKDSIFLASKNVNDYSLLIGIHEISM
jgi:1-phosphatidylinositol-4-phosphate 5-kinase